MIVTFKASLVYRFSEMRKYACRFLGRFIGRDGPLDILWRIQSFNYFGFQVPHLFVV
jgi:hypothetical protein